MVSFNFLRACQLALLASSTLVAAVLPRDSLSPRGDGPDKKFTLTLTWEKGSPDGYARNMFMINGQFPGPLLEVNEGDKVVVKVVNKSPYETTIHYHGIEMLGTPWSDGVPGVTQYHIQPGCSFKYKWTATQHGAFFYHSHTESQVNDGLYGPIVIHPKADRLTPYSKISSDAAACAAMVKAEKERIPLFLHDWRHIQSDTEWAISQKSHLEHICFDSMLINGKGNVNCLKPAEQTPLITPGQAALLSLVPGSNLTSKSCVPAKNLAVLGTAPGKPTPDLSVIPSDLFGDCSATTSAGAVTTIKMGKGETEKWVMFDLIGAFSLHTSAFSIDEIRTWVIAIDGNFIEPVAADALVLFNGQRYTVIAKFVKPKKYTVRLSALSDPQILFGTSVIDFQADGQKQSTDASVASIDRRGAPTSSSVIVYDGSKSVPFGTPAVSQKVDASYKVVMQIDGPINMWAFNETARPDMEGAVPLLFQPKPGLMDNHTITVPSDKSWVDYIMVVPVGQPPHPVHIHGRHFYVMGSGSGPFNWSTTAEAAKAMPANFNLVNPALRDTYITPPTQIQEGWLVLRRASDNEGAWLIHCHVQSHLQGGMSMVIQDGTDKYPKIPQKYLDYKC